MLFTSLLIQKILNKVGCLPILRIGYTLKVLNTLFRIPIIENKVGFGYHQSITEPFLLNIFKELYRHKDFLFVDVGVNFGQTLLKLKAVKHDASYIGFEPIGLCSYYTSLLIKVNSLLDARIIRCALSDSQGVIIIYSHGEGDTRSTIIKEQIESNNVSFQEHVPVLTLDIFSSLILEHEKEIILKVDVEGAEKLVFEGADNVITLKRPVVIFENLPFTLSRVKEKDQLDIANYFLGKSYLLFSIEQANGRIANITNLHNKDNFSSLDILAIPREKKDWISGLL